VNTNSVVPESVSCPCPQGAGLPDRSQGRCQGRVVTRCTPDPVVKSPERQSFYLSPAADDAWIADPHLPTNYLPGRPPVEGLVPEPPPRWQEKLQQDLKPNDWWKQGGQSSRSVNIYEGWVLERKRAEANGEEFKFPPLKPTLENMQTFVAHILAGRQFPAPLTGKETRAIEWVQTKAQELLDADAPYKRTVHLAIALMTLCEIVTDRQVLEPVCQQASNVVHSHVSRLDRWSRRLEPDGCFVAGCFSAAALDPEWVTRLHWGGNNPGGDDEKVELFCGYSDALYEALNDYVHVPEILIFPSFDALNLEDFCRFGHLPVYPVGMSTAYALNADGFMMSPLRFAAHDLGHMCVLEAGDATQDQAEGHRPCPVLASYERRLAWRRLLLDRAPACLGLSQPDTADILLMFQLLHEFAPEHYESCTKDFCSGFVLFLRKLTRVRKDERGGYDAVYQAVTDSRAVTAAFWAMRLWTCWQAADYGQVTEEQLQSCASQFVREDAPWLQKHLDFLKRHRAALRHLFYEICRLVDSTRVGVSLNQIFGAAVEATLFSPQDEHSGLHNLDNTELAYFAALASPELRQKIADRTGAAVPDVTLLGLEDVRHEPEAMDVMPADA